MTKRLELFEALRAELLKINRANGYLNEIKQVHPVMRRMDEVNSYPAIYAVPGEEQVKQELEERSLFDSEFEILVLTHIEVPSDTDESGLYTYEAEKWIEDYRRFISGNERSVCSTIHEMEGVISCYISRIEPYFDTGANRQTLMITVKIHYIFSIE